MDYLPYKINNILLYYSNSVCSLLFLTIFVYVLYKNTPIFTLITSFIMAC